MKQFKKYLGLCSASKSIVCGSEMVINSIRKDPKKIFLCIAANDISERTKKQISDKCTYYNVPLYFSDMSMNELSESVGKMSLVSVLAVTNKGLAEEIKKAINFNNTEN